MDATNGGPRYARGPRRSPRRPGAGRGVRMEAGRSPALRVSDRERDAVVQRVQAAFAEGRLDDTEFDERMRAALTARTRGDLDVLLTDLPAETAAPGPAPATAGRGPGRLAIALKSSVRRGGRWRVPERYTTVVYKGSGWLDLRAAELSGPVTTFVAVAYKSRVTILVPPGAAGRDDRLRRHPGRGRGGSRVPAADGRPGDPRARRRVQGHGGDHHPAAGASGPAPVSLGLGQQSQGSASRSTARPANDFPVTRRQS